MTFELHAEGSTAATRLIFSEKSAQSDLAVLRLGAKTVSSHHIPNVGTLIQEV
ncbi:MAG TPA: hypothetical protein VGM98_05205 [Schlesneria sp.]